MAIAWVLNHPAVTTVLTGASRAEQIEANCRVLQAESFTQEQLLAIENVLNTEKN